MLSTAHPGKFAEAVSRALQSSSQSGFDADFMPDEFRELSDKEKRVIDVEKPDVGLVKAVIEKVMSQ